MKKGMSRSRVTRLALGRKSYQKRLVDVFGSSVLALWPLNEASGSVVYDTSGNARNGAYGGPTLKNVSNPKGNGGCPSFDGTNDYIDLYSAGLSTAFNGAEGTVLLWFKMSSANVWTDGAVRYLFNITGDADNTIYLQKPAANNQLIFQYKAATTAETITAKASDTGWVCAALTWSASADEVKGYLNGIQVGAAQSSLGAWGASGLSSTATVLGGEDTTPTTTHSGWMAYAVILNRAATLAEIRRAYELPIYELLPSGYFKAMATGATLYAAANSRYGAKSTDYGSTWTNFAKQFDYAVFSVFPTTTAGRLLLSCYGAIWRSTDDGANWTQAQALTDTTTYINPWGWAEDAGGNIYAGEYGNETKCAYLYKSADGGATFTRIDYFYPLTNKHLHQVFVDVETNRLYVTIGDSVKKTYYSDDQGANWTEIFAAVTTGFTGATSIPGARFFGDDIQVGTGNKIKKSIDDANLTDSYTPSTAYDVQFVEVSAVHGGAQLYGTFYNENQAAGNFSSIVYSPDGGATWQQILTSPSGDFRFSFICVDYRHRIPTELGYMVFNVTFTRMARIPVRV